MHVNKCVSVLGGRVCSILFWLNLCRENFLKKLRTLLRQTGPVLPALDLEERISISVKDNSPEKEFESEMSESCP